MDRGSVNVDSTRFGHERRYDVRSRSEAMMLGRTSIGAVTAALCISWIVTFARAASAEESAGDLDPRIVKMIGAISESRLDTILKKLESFDTRNTLSSVDSPARGIGAARQWIFDEMTSYSPKLQVSFDIHRVPKQGRITREIELRNVLAILPGRTPRRIYISGHYDTVARAGGQSASNASGAPRDPDAPQPVPADANAPADNLAPGVNDAG